MSDGAKLGDVNVDASGDEKKMGQQTQAAQSGSDIVEHRWELPEVCKKFKTTTEKGLLNEAAVQASRTEYGKNEITPPPTRPCICVFMDHLTGFFSLLLWLAGILCFIAYGLDSNQIEYLYLGVVLVVVVLLTGIFSFYQDYSSSKTMDAIKGQMADNARVRRNGEVRDNLPANELVCGDIVIIKNGDRIPADLYVFKAKNLKVNNSSLTGESEPIKLKEGASSEINPNESKNLAFSGTMCENGNGEGVVIRTGDNTLIGNISSLVMAQDTTKTPIAIEIEHFVHIVSAVAIFLGVTFLIIGFIKGTTFINNMVFAIGIIVANVPEGLLATVTVSLTLTSNRMATKSVMVRKLESVETLGSTNVIASDKTGTLTQNRMTVEHVWYDHRIWNASAGTAAKKKKKSVAKEIVCERFNTDDPTFQKLVLGATLCNNTTFDTDAKNMDTEVIHRKCDGDASETAFVKFTEPVLSAQYGFNIKQQVAIDHCRDEHPCIAEVPFNSANKFHVKICQQTKGKEGENGDKILWMKGAPERVYDRCDKIMSNGNSENITEEITSAYNSHLRDLMFQGERVLGVAYTVLKNEDFPHGFEYETDASTEEEYNFPLRNLTFIGLVAVIDPPRPAVPSSVLLCQKAGIKVVMVTGDHPDTAASIAKQVNIIRSKTLQDIAFERGLKSVKDIDKNDPEIQNLDAIIVTGMELAVMKPDELDRVLDYDQIVFARTSPKQKLIIVKGMQKKTHNNKDPNNPRPVKHIVAVTGDGVNDSPAIRRADIGIAMGQAGVAVAKEAADMILMNDNFASLVDGVEEGRLIFDNLKKSIAYTLSSNIPEISPFLAYILISCPLPLPTVLILCIDLGTDLVPAISLAYENKEANIMEKAPRDSRVDRLVTAKLVNFSYLQVGVFQAAAGFFAWVVVLFDYGFVTETLPGFSWAFENFQSFDNTRAIPDLTHFAYRSFDGVRTNEDSVRQLNASRAIINPFGGEDGFGTFCDMESPADNRDCRPLRQCTYGWPGDSPEDRMRHINYNFIKDPNNTAEDVEFCRTSGNLYCGLSPLPVTNVNPCQNPLEALAHAQTAFFISIIIVQWADLVACKTRQLSIAQQGMRNGVLNFGLFFETALGAALCYITPLNGLGTRAIRFEHWLVALPFTILIFMYDETRKMLLRNPADKSNWVYANTYY